MSASVPLNINSSATLNTGNFQLAFGGDFINSGTFTAGSAPVVISDVATAQNIAGFTTTGLVSMTKTYGTATLQGIISCAGITVNGSGGTLNMGSALSHSTSAAVTLSAGTLDGGSSNITVTGSNWTNNGGTFTPTTSTVTFSGNASSINGTASSQTFNNLTLGKTAGQALTIGGSTTALNVNGVVMLTSGTFTAGSTNITANSDWTNNGATFTPGTSNVTFTGNNSAINGSAATQTFNNFTVNKTAGQSLSFGGSTTALTMNGNLTLSAGIFNAGSNSITITGNWTNNGGTFTQGTSTVTFNSTTADQTIGGSAASLFNNLTETKNTNKIILSQPTTIGGTLTMTSGNIDASAATLQLGTSTSSVGTLAYTAGTIIGCFERWINATGIGISFPVGTIASNNLALVTFTNLTSGNLTVCFIGSDPGSLGLSLLDGTFVIGAQFTQGYWSMTAGGGLASNNYDLQLNGYGFSGLTFDANVRIIKRAPGGPWTSTNWGTQVAAIPATYTARRTGLSVFGEFGLGQYSCSLNASVAGSDALCNGGTVP